MRAAVYSRSMVSALGIRIPMIYAAGVRRWASGWPRFAGGVFLPLLPMALGVDHDIIVQCFAVVVIGGFGSMLGTFVASIIVGVVYSFSILFWPDGALAMIFLIVIVVLIWRPWGLFGTELRYLMRRHERTRQASAAGWHRLRGYSLSVPVAILLFVAVPAGAAAAGQVLDPRCDRDPDPRPVRDELQSALRLHGADLVRARRVLRRRRLRDRDAVHAPEDRRRRRSAMLEFFLSLLAGPPVAALGALIVGFFCVRLTGIYFAMLSLAFGELLFYIVFSWYSFTKGDDGIQGLLPPPFFQDAVNFYYLTLAIVTLALLRDVAHHRVAVRLHHAHAARQPAARGVPRHQRARCTCSSTS